jgi:3-oxoacyl-(acyl-carrier-protein) synthase
LTVRFGDFVAAFAKSSYVCFGTRKAAGMHVGRDPFMMASIRGSGMTPREIGAVNTHGTATIKGDLAVKRVFQQPQR